MVAAGGDRQQLERIRDQLTSGGRQGVAGMFGGGRGGGQAEPGGWVERPAENWNVQGRGGGGGFTPEMRAIMEAARDITGGGGFGRGGRGGGQGSLVDAGNYTVILKVGDQEYRQTLQVIKGPDAGEGGGFFEESEESSGEIW